MGLDPALGVLHSPRTAAPPLALDLMELFRVPLVDAMVLAAVNQGVFDAADDFDVVGAVHDAPVKVWLSDAGRKKLIRAYARRKQTEVRHPVLGYSLSFARTIGARGAVARESLERRAGDVRPLSTAVTV